MKKSGKNGRRRKDVEFEEIMGNLNSRKRQERKEERENGINREIYVDSYRSVSTELGGTKQDLKDKMASMNSSGFDAASCCSDELMYLRQADHLMRISRTSNALLCLNTALHLNRKREPFKEKEQKIFVDIATKLASCHLKLGNLIDANDLAEEVLEIDETNVKATYAKAEALYYNCEFEQALVIYYRGSRRASDKYSFRLGIENCRNAIQQALKDTNLFNERFSEVVCQLLRIKALLKSRSRCETPRSTRKLSVHGLTSIINSKKCLENPEKSIISASTKSKNLLHATRLQQEMGLKLKYTPKKKPKSKNSKDESSKEKSYLKSLKISIMKSGRDSDQEDPLTIKLSNEVDDALNFLDAREEFWKQMNVRKIH